MADRIRQYQASEKQIEAEEHVEQAVHAANPACDAGNVSVSRDSDTSAASCGGSITHYLGLIRAGRSFPVVAVVDPRGCFFAFVAGGEEVCAIARADRFGV